MKVIAIVPAAGSGKRLRSGAEKPFIKIRSKPLILYTLKALSGAPGINSIVLVVRRKFVDKARRLVRVRGLRKVKFVVEGGKTRAESVLNGLKAVDSDAGIILIHDGVRPLLDGRMIKNVIGAARRFGAACVSVPVKPTIKKVKKGCITGTLKRDTLYEAQTPQAFKKDIILKAYRSKFTASSTDDSSLVERLGVKVRVVEGSYSNIKVTTEEDLLLAKALLK